MAEDTIGLMDVLGIKSAHLVGASMGGMIAQEIAISFPQRVRSLTSIMSTTGNPKVPPPTREAAAMLMAPPPTTKEEYFERFAQDLENPARRLASRRTRRSTARAPNAPLSAASIRPASAGSCARCWPPAAARNGCAR